MSRKLVSLARILLALPFRLTIRGSCQEVLGFCSRAAVPSDLLLVESCEGAFHAVFQWLQRTRAPPLDVERHRARVVFAQLGDSCPGHLGAGKAALAPSLAPSVLEGEDFAFPEQERTSKPNRNCPASNTSNARKRIPLVFSSREGIRNQVATALQSPSEG